MDRFEAMKIFVKVAELQSFTQAAESLFLPKASVSTSIRQLESAVSTRLLNRTTRRVQLTPEGLSFYERCKDILADIEETESMFRHQPGQLSGKIRVDMNLGMARNLMIPQLAAFLAEHPGLEIELSSTDRRVDLLREGLDCVLRVGSALEPGLGVKELGSLAIVNCASPAYLARYGIPLSLEDLSRHQLIYYVQHLGAKAEGFEYFDGESYREFKMPGRLTVNSTQTYDMACLEGLGIIQAPLPGVRKHLQSGALVEILPQYRAEPMPLKLIYPQHRLLSRRIRVFMDWLELLVAAYLEPEAA